MNTSLTVDWQLAGVEVRNMFDSFTEMDSRLREALLIHIVNRSEIATIQNIRTQKKWK